MKNEDVDSNIAATQSNDIGKALTELKVEYLSDLQNKQFSKMLTINTRYVSNVSIGYRMKTTAPHNRFEPYKYHKERHRTKSENCETEENCFENNYVDKLDNTLEEINQLKRAKSLESITAEGTQIVDFKHFSISRINELEAVSDSIQNLKVVE